MHLSRENSLSSMTGYSTPYDKTFYYSFEGVDRDMIWELDETEKSDKVVVAKLMFIVLANDQLSELVLVPGYESVFVIDKQPVAEIIHFFPLN